MTAASPDALPDNLDTLRAVILAERAEKQLLIVERDGLAAERDQLSAANDKLHHIIAVLRRARFGRKSERLSEEQLNLVLEELETASAKTEAEEEKKDENLKREQAKKRRANRGSLPAHLPRIERVIEPESTICPCCGKAMYVIGEDKSERLDKVPAMLRVIVTRRPKYGCKCEEAVVQAPAPPRLIEGGIPTETLVADVVVSKYADHLPLYRQAQIFTRQGIRLDRSTMAAWVGAAAAELEPLYDRLVAILKGMSKLFADETRCPVLDPGRGKTKPGYFWAIACDDRPWASPVPPAVIYSYAPGRGGKYVETLLEGFSGILQVDGYDGYNILTRPDLRKPGCLSIMIRQRIPQLRIKSQPGHAIHYGLTGECIQFLEEVGLAAFDFLMFLTHFHVPSFQSAEPRFDYFHFFLPWSGLAFSSPAAGFGSGRFSTAFGAGFSAGFLWSFVILLTFLV